GGEHVAVGEHALANVAPATLDLLLGVEGSADVVPEGAQLKVNLLLSRLPRLRDTSVDPADAFLGTFHVNEGYAQLAAAHARAAPGPGALRDLLPLAHRSVDPRPRAAGGGRADADLLRPAPPGAALRGRSRRRALACARGDAGLAGQRARRARARLRVARRRR